MSHDRTDPDPSAEQLAAFLDDELALADRSRVEAWLAVHPAAADELEEQRRLHRLWSENAPPEPGPGAWAATLGRIEARLRRPGSPRTSRTLWLGAGLAAAFVGAALLTQLFFPPAVPRGAGRDAPLPVIGPGDVTIVSMDARDAAGLMVAAPPVEAPILLASQDDVSVMNVQSYWKDDGRVPQIGEGEVPMIVAPQFARDDGREP